MNYVLYLPLFWTLALMLFPLWYLAGSVSPSLVPKSLVYSLLLRLRKVLFFLFLFIDALVHPFRLSSAVKNRKCMSFFVVYRHRNVIKLIQYSFDLIFVMMWCHCSIVLSLKDTILAFFTIDVYYSSIFVIVCSLLM